MSKSHAAMSCRLASSRGATNVAAAVLTFIGLLGPIGYLTGISRIANLGRVTAASPLPLVFVGAAEWRCSLSVTLQSGRDVERPCERGLLDQIRGPFWRRYIYFRALGQPRGGRKQSKEQVAILEYGMCSHRGLASDLGIDELVRRLVVFRWSAVTPSVARSPSFVMCGE